MTTQNEASELVEDVRRRLGITSKNGADAKVLTISQTYDTDMADVWDAITSAERIPRWLLPVSGELRLGGQYQLEGNAGGTILECEPSTHLGVTWEFGGEVSWVTARLSEEAGSTTLVVDHVAHVDAERVPDFGPGAIGIGWDLMLLGLSRHLSSGGSITPEAAMAWTVSPEGLEFMTLSGEAWRDADIAAGTPAADARARADRCIAAYTSAPEA